MSERIHPMTQKARRLFAESMEERTPIRWLMIHQQRIRQISEAVRVFMDHVQRYPDIAEKYDAEDILREEMIRERQAVIKAKTKREAVTFLSVWYNRPRTAMAYRYQTIMDEVKKMDPEVLNAEKEDFAAIELNTQDINSEMITAIAESSQGETSSYSMLAIANIRRRIDELEAKKQALQEEKIGRRGIVKEILDKIEKTEAVIAAIDTVAEELSKEDDDE